MNDTWRCVVAFALSASIAHGADVPAYFVGTWEIDVQRSTNVAQRFDGSPLPPKVAFHLVTLDVTNNTFSIIAPYAEMQIVIGKQVPCVAGTNALGVVTFRKTVPGGGSEEYGLAALTNGTVQLVKAPGKLNVLCAYVWRKRASNPASHGTALPRRP